MFAENWSQRADFWRPPLLEPRCRFILRGRLRRRVFREDEIHEHGVRNVVRERFARIAVLRLVGELFLFETVQVPSAAAETISAAHSQCSTQPPSPRHYQRVAREERKGSGVGRGHVDWMGECFSSGGGGGSSTYARTHGRTDGRAYHASYVNVFWARRLSIGHEAALELANQRQVLVVELGGAPDLENLCIHEQLGEEVFVVCLECLVLVTRKVPLLVDTAHVLASGNQPPLEDGGEA